ncbi:class I SAM-dependent methyltransferase [Candidatus Gracilibacteria bacterium]|nr:class I SAM-dependent methyltransferase [Candidatus Gracilibacteria bacterium]
MFQKFKKLLIKSSNDNWHEDFIVHLAKVLKPNVYVELGLYKCELFNRIIPHSKKLIGVDLSTDAGKYMKKTDKTTFYNMTTDECYLKLKEQNLKIDLLFIDANHSKESVKLDFDNYFNLVSDQGVILLHDGFPRNKKFTESGYCGDGYLAIKELTQEKDRYEMMTIPMHPGVTICRKRKNHLDWK